MRLSQHFGHSSRQVHEVPETHGAYALLRAGYAAWESGGGRWALWPLGERLAQRVFAAWQRALASAGSIVAPGGEADFWRLAGLWGAPARPRLPRPWARWLALQVMSYRHLPRTLASQGASAWWALRLAAEAEPAPWMAMEDFWRAIGLGEVMRLAAAEDTQVWAWPHPQGEAEALTCACGYAALQPWATRAKALAPPEEPQALRAVSTPGANTIRALAAQLGIPPSRTAKAVFLTDEASGALIFAVVRGDMEVSLPKVQIALGTGPLRPATEAEIRAVGAEPGYASPIGVQGARVVVDTLIPRSPNLVAGANRPDTHFVGVNYGRDFQAEVVADIVAAQPGDPCPRCGRALSRQSVLPLAQGAALRPDEQVAFRTPEGKTAPVFWSPLRVDPWHVLVALAAVHRDAQGLRWPVSLAPYLVHLVALRGGEEAAEALYHELQTAEVAVLYDDRAESPGVKFTDADLLGLPLRLTVGRHSLSKGGVEIRLRASGEQHLVPLEQAVAWIQAWLERAL
ncbi:MAG TPA: hypothetical protein EYP54_00610 [Anaerolineales bacterium]|nr:hypothetical protein [Anaerolineales bacterium]